MSIKAIIFDLGGVILRTEDTAPRSALGLRFDKTYLEMDKIVFGAPTSKKAGCGEISAHEHMKHVLRALSLPETDEAIQSFYDEFFAGDKLDESIIDYLRALRADPKYTTALLSNAWDDLRDMLINKWAIDDAFDEIFISAEIGIAKPDERIYKIVLEKLGIAPEETVFVDDFIENIEAARKLGMHGIHFQDVNVAMAELRALLD